MSRTVIAAVIATIIAAVTIAAYFAVSSTIDDRARKDAEYGVKRAKKQLMRTAQLESLSILTKAEQLSADAGFVKALTSTDSVDRGQQATLAFGRFQNVGADNEAATGKSNEIQADIIALLDSKGNLVAMNGLDSVVPKQWKNDKGERRWPALTEVLRRRAIISEIWDYPNSGMMKVGIASIIDPNMTRDASNPDGIAGAVVVAYSETSAGARKEAEVMGVDLAFVNNKATYATSFSSSEKKSEDTEKQKEITRVINEDGDKLFAATGALVRVKIDGESFVAMGVPLPRQSSVVLPKGYPVATAAAVVLAAIGDAGGLSSVKLYVLAVGAIALLMAMLGMFLVHRRMIAQIDPIELGVTDIINGNIDRTFRPVGSELDGLANGLNVMMARLLGRPEPGEEEYDDDGNPIVPGRVEFDEAEAQTSKGPDPDLAALAQESEPDYYKRVFTEYLTARKSIGQPDEVSFENFIAKLKMNEGKLRAQHNCKAVRFRVVVKDGKVSLKPVPIFA
jgi:hypothetical protein